MKRLKSTHLLMLSVLLVVFACKKAKNLKIDETPPPKPSAPKTYVPVKFETAGSSLILKYKDLTSLLSEIADANGNKTVFTYTQERQPFKLEKYRNEKLFYVVYYEQSDKKTTSKARAFGYNVMGVFTPVNVYTLTNNDQQKIKQLDYYDLDNKLTNTYSLFYSASGNLSEMNARAHPGSTTMTTYTFDQQKGISRYISHSELFAFESEHWFFLCPGNNILNVMNEKTPQKNISVKYEYNENGYPSTAIITSNDRTQNIKITYKQLET
ncbi:hypothetical protein [Pedobacter nyackensis]|uniref:hypothetical protein n=1 Tax=Pedobacter nyackensis TaxID=475255 RepID=UPI00292D71E2|nr:hypothetical protein [Pedobacter nyackensis]